MNTFYRMYLNTGVQWADPCKRMSTAIRHASQYGVVVGWQKIDLDTGEEIERSEEIPNVDWVSFPSGSKFDRIVYQ